MLSFVRNKRAGELLECTLPEKVRTGSIVLPSYLGTAKLIITTGARELLECFCLRKSAEKVRTDSLVLPSDSETAKLIITMEISNSYLEQPLNSRVRNTLS